MAKPKIVGLILNPWGCEKCFKCNKAPEYVKIIEWTDRTLSVCHKCLEEINDGQITERANVGRS